MDDHPVFPIEIESHNNEDGSTLSSCTGSNMIVVIAPNDKKNRNRFQTNIYVVKNTYQEK